MLSIRPIISEEKALSPVCVSKTETPETFLKTKRVTVFPNWLLSGTFPVKRRPPDDQGLGIFFGGFRHFHGILHAVLSVRIHGNDRQDKRNAVPDVGESCFEGCPFSAVCLMLEDVGTAGYGCKNCPVIRPGSVIHDNRAEACFRKAFNEMREIAVRFISRNQGDSDRVIHGLPPFVYPCLSAFDTVILNRKCVHFSSKG
jgi:hypothetical protein